MIKKTVWCCEFCNDYKDFTEKEDALEHEKDCFRNPNNKGCGSCTHWKYISGTYHCYINNNDDEEEDTCNSWEQK